MLAGSQVLVAAQLGRVPDERAGGGAVVAADRGGGAGHCPAAGGPGVGARAGEVFMQQYSDVKTTVNTCMPLWMQRWCTLQPIWRRQPLAALRPMPYMQQRLATCVVLALALWSCNNNHNAPAPLPSSVPAAVAGAQRSAPICCINACSGRAGSRSSDAAVGVAVLRLAVYAGRRVRVGLGLLESKWGALPSGTAGSEATQFENLLRPAVTEASALRDDVKGAPMFVILRCRCQSCRTTAAWHQPESPAVCTGPG